MEAHHRVCQSAPPMSVFRTSTLSKTGMGCVRDDDDVRVRYDSKGRNLCCVYAGPGNSEMVRKISSGQACAPSKTPCRMKMGQPRKRKAGDVVPLEIDSEPFDLKKWSHEQGSALPGEAEEEFMDVVSETDCIILEEPQALESREQSGHAASPSRGEEVGVSQ